ncbi:unnamed protein product [Caenorhabditis brenneri]
MENYEVKKHLESPGSVQLSCGGDEEYVEDIDFNMKEWLEHLQFIFNCPEISDIVCGVKSSQFDIDCLTKVFKGCTKIDTEDWKSTDFNRKFLCKILIDKPSLYSDFFEDSKVPNSLLIQNFEYLWIHFPSGANSTLDQLLMINSKVIISFDIGNLANTMNKFIKMWIKGASPRLEFLHVDLMLNEDEFDLDGVLKGIKHSEVSMDQERTFKSTGLERHDVVDLMAQKPQLKFGWFSPPIVTIFAFFPTLVQTTGEAWQMAIKPGADSI